MFKLLAILLVSIFVISLAISPALAVKIYLVGDLSGTAVRNAIAAKNPSLVIALGDLTYGSTLSTYKTNYVNFFTPAKSKCVIGNHDSTEDGSSSIYTEAKNLCGQLWRLTIANKSTSVIGFNSNGNLDTQLGTAQGWVMNSTYMSTIKNVIILAHKPAYTSPNSHHPVEAGVKTFVDSLKAKVPSNVHVYLVSGHNHQMAKTKDSKIFVSGAGGRSHYSCGTNTMWPWCNNSVYGYLEFNILDNGTLKSHFFNSNNVMIK